MISIETLEKLSKQYQTGLIPNVIREYFQHVFLAGLYRLPEGEKMLFKGGTALRIIYGSPRFSEDLDFSLFGVLPREIKSFAESVLVKVLSEIESVGIEVEIGEKSGATTGGYFSVATFKVFDYQPVGVEINVSSRNGKSVRGEVDSIAGDFVPTYSILHLPQHEMVEEKIFGALRERKKPRDFYDLYFLMRKNMLSPDQKKQLAEVKDDILRDAGNINFRGELSIFLPADQQIIIRDFVHTLEAEITRHIA